MGMRQRLGVAACLIADPQLLILKLHARPSNQYRYEHYDHAPRSSAPVECYRLVVAF